MLRTVAAAALAGLGLVGGGGPAKFSCPANTNDKVRPYDLALARLDVTLQQVRRAERAIERQYPSHRAPVAVIQRYQALQRRDDRLVSAYNHEVDRRNAIVDRDCTPE